MSAIKACESPTCNVTECQARVAHQLLAGSERMDAMQAEIKANTALTLALKTDTSELLEILNAGKGGLKVLGWIGTVVKWVGGMAATAIAIYGFLQVVLHGAAPPK